MRQAVDREIVHKQYKETLFFFFHLPIERAGQTASQLPGKGALNLAFAKCSGYGPTIVKQQISSEYPTFVIITGSYPFVQEKGKPRRAIFSRRGWYAILLADNYIDIQQQQQAIDLLARDRTKY